ncbi:MAG: hypothetical protein NTV01_22030, partial [Bacteroidia bacterium]|nr:hypothetical protein [Bacteroidia bacterium]
MFAANSYFEVNREERHFAFLFASAIIYNHRFRAMVFDNYNDLNGTRLISEAGQFDIYMEVTALRDYWKEIDRRTTEPKADPSIVILEKSRIISKILESEKIDPEIIRKEDFFWTCKESANRKIWYPGHWNAKAIDESKTLNPA